MGQDGACLARTEALERGKKKRVVALGIVLAALVLAGLLLSARPAHAAELTVTNTDDSGPGSLREAITSANSNGQTDTIEFAPDVEGTVTLTGGELRITNDSEEEGLTIKGPGADKLAVSGNNASRVFRIDRGAKVAIEGLTVREGLPSDKVAGGIENSGTLALTDSTVSDNRADGAGGIYNSNDLTLTNSTVSGNEVRLIGAGIYSDTSRSGGTTTIRNSTISGNTASDGVGGGVLNISGRTVIENSTVTNNSASDSSGLGGGVVSLGSTEVRSSILSGNADGDAVYAGDTNPYASGGHNLVGSGNGAGTFIATGDQTGVSEPRLGPLAVNGGPNETHLPLDGSPAIDKGNSFGLTTDQRGETRPQDHPSIANASGGDGSDVGAVELAVSKLELSVSGVIATEGNSGTTDAAFQVRLSKPPIDPVTVEYATEDDTAAAPGDYADTSGTLTFAPGDVSEAVTVPVQGDTLDEFAEAFYLNLSNPVGASIADGSAAATIRDDDPTPSLSVDDVSVSEAGSGTTTARFTVSLSAPSGKVVLADYSTADGSARVADGDYAETSGTLTFRPGASTRTVSVPVNSDTASEQDEDFFLDLSGAQNATVADVQGEGTIKDAPPPADTTPPTVSVTPRNGAMGVSRKAQPTAMFSDEMDPDSLSASTVKLHQWNANKKKWQPVPAAVSVEAKTATLDPYPRNPSRLLGANKRYKVTITTGAKNMAGLPLDSTKSSTFTTRR